MSKLLSKLIDPTVLAGFAFMLIIISFICLYIWRNRGLLPFTLLAFMLMSFFIIILNYVFNLVPMNPDTLNVYIPAAQSYSKNLRFFGDLLAELGNLKLSLNIDDKYIGYTLPLGIVFFIFDNSVIAGSLVSTIFSGLTIFMIYQFAKELFDEDTAKISILLLAFSPYYIFISSVIMRDTIVVFFIIWYYRLWLLYEKKPLLKYKILIVFVILYLGMLRPAIMAIIVSTSILYKLFFDRNPYQSKATIMIKKYIKILIISLFAFVTLGVVSGYVNMQTIKDYRLLSGLKYTDIAEINQRVEFSEDAGSSYFQDIRKYQTPMDIIKNLPLLSVYFMASPFPWQVGKGKQYIALMDASVLWVIYLLFFMQARKFYRRNKKWAIIIYSYLLLGIPAAAMLQTNIGSAQRHRIMFTVIMLPFAANQIISMVKSKKSVERRVSFSRV